MALTRKFEVGNLDQWGRLVKSWATHLDYVSQPYDNQPPRKDWVKQPAHSTEPGPAPATLTDQGKPWVLPEMKRVDAPNAGGGKTAIPGAIGLTVDEFKDRLAKAGVTGVFVPEQYKKVVIVQGDKDTMIVRLPPQDELQGSEDDLLNGAAYRIPAFYNGLWYPGFEPRLPNAVDDKASTMMLHAARIGEYTLNNCM